MSEQMKAQAKKMGLNDDWVNTLLDRIGPAALQAVLTFLNALQHPGMGAGESKCECPKEVLDCLDQCIVDQCESLRKCCEKRCRCVAE